MDNFFVKWDNIKLNVLVFSDITNYSNLPNASLYINNKLITTPVNYINKYINYTTISTVTTCKVGKYYVYYKAIFNEYDIEDIIKVEFIVIDNVAPILKTKTINIKVNNKVDLNKLLSYEDNYTKLENILISFNQENVNYNQVGSYIVRVYLEDEFLNSSYYDIDLKIYDDELPLLRITDDIVLNLNSNYDDILDYLVITDNDKNHEVKIKFLTKLDFSKVGDYKVELELQDFSLNTLKTSINVKIKDLIPPTLKLKDYYLELNDFDDKLLYDNILEVSDNYSKVSISILPYVKTAYTNITYQITDESNNKKEEYLTIRLNKFRPKIIGETLYLKKFSSIKDLFIDLEAIDYNYSDLTRKIMLLEHNVVDKEGKYSAIYKVNGSLDYSIFKRTIVIENSKNKLNTKYVSYAFIGIIILIIIVIVYKKIKNKKFKF